MRRVEGGNRDPTVRPDNTACLGERGRSVDEMDHERHGGPVEPSVSERKALGVALPYPDPGRDRGTGGGDHPVALVDAPDLGMCIRGERGCEPARAASDIQDAPATEVAELDQGLEATPPGLIRRTERVVEAGARVEIGATTLGHDSVCAGRRDRRAPRGTRTGRPCSAKGISMMSKSRGTTVSGKSSPASAAASFPA